MPVADDDYNGGDRLVLYNSTMKMLDKMAEIMRAHGVEIYCPWDGSLDDEEQERFNGLVAILDYQDKVSEVA